ncbi:hypothetical protein ACOSQ2_019978 [Xanthoceras sorbifolium]
MFGSTSTLVENLIDNGLNSNIRREAKCVFWEYLICFVNFAIEISRYFKCDKFGTKRSCQHKDMSQLCITFTSVYLML